LFERVVVIGGGAAGLAAAWAAAPRGAQLRLLDSGVGATGLGSGAIDDRPWEEVERSMEVLGVDVSAGPLPEAVELFAGDLGLWRLPRAGEPFCRVATEAGRVRVARGAEIGLLDLAALPEGARVLLPRMPRPEWDAESLAHALNADAYAVARRLRFEAADAKLWKLAGEERIAAADLAGRHDDEARLGWLRERLREMLARAGRAHAVLTGPWLGLARPAAPKLSSDLGLPVGEALAGVGSPAGLRFEAARDRMLAGLGLARERHRVSRVRARGSELVVTVDGGDEVIADGVVLAIGGVAAGGVVYDPPEQRAGQEMAPAGARPFRLSLQAPIELAWQGRRLDVVSSIHGPSLDDVAWPVDADPSCLEAIGVSCDGAQAAPGIFAAGDVVADKPRTVLQAVWSGIRAGAAAAGEPGSL
jgi:glycerol-3-phosphate dehydrogenase subunit B